MAKAATTRASEMRHLAAVWRETLRRLEADGGAVVPEPDAGEEPDTMFWHRGVVVDSGNGRHPGWVLLEHPPGSDPGRPDELMVKVGPQWRVGRCMPDRMWDRFDGYRYKLDVPCPRDGHKCRHSD